MERKIVGLTGGIASGKSTAADLFRENGVDCIDADEVGRELLAPHMPGWEAIKNNFGRRFFRDDATLDRALLRREIFADQDLRKQIDSILHPLIRTRIDEIIRGKEGKIVLVEVPLLFEAGWVDDFDEIIVVYADKEQSLQRLIARDNVSPKEALSAQESQLPLKEKIKRATRLIDNGGSRNKTLRQVKEIINSWAGT